MTTTIAKQQYTSFIFYGVQLCAFYHSSTAVDFLLWLLFLFVYQFYPVYLYNMPAGSGSFYSHYKIISFFLYLAYNSAELSYWSRIKLRIFSPYRLWQSMPFY